MKHYKVEFHCHTNYSKDSLAPVEDVLETCRQRGVDKVAITDHNTIKGALVAKQLDPERVIIGEEILVKEGGEILALFVKEEIPVGLPYKEAIRRLRAQGAFISISHPYDYQRKGWLEKDLLEITPQIDAIEVFNSRALSQSINDQAVEFARLHNLAGTVGSDAHCLYEIGRSTLTVPVFESAEELRNVIRDAQQTVQASPIFVRFYSRFSMFCKGVLGLGYPKEENPSQP